MGRRYSDIKRANKLKAGLDAYITHLQTAATRPSKIGTRGPSNLTQTVYVEPFTVDYGVGTVASSRCTPTSYTTLEGSINASSIAAVTNALGGKTQLSIPKFSAARVVLFRNNTRVVSTPRSEVTGLEYLKYSGTRFSCPFGGTADVDDMVSAFLDVKARLLQANAAAAVKRVSLVREKVGIEAA